MVFVKNFELQTFCSEARNNTTITADRNWAGQYRVNFNEVFPKIRATLNDLNENLQKYRNSYQNTVLPNYENTDKNQLLNHRNSENYGNSKSDLRTNKRWMNRE